MSKTNKNIPELRFPEFVNDGEWEEKSIEETCNLVRGPFGGALKKEIFVEDGYAVYEQSHAIYGDFNSYRYFINHEKFNELKRFRVDSGDLIMSCSGTMGKFSMIPKDFKKGVINQALLKISVKKGFDVSFIKTLLETEQTQDKLLSQSAGGAIKNVVSVSQIKEILLPVPSIEEQQKIASCLSSLDELITGEEQRLEQLTEHKKGLMQNLFPQEGEIVPKYCFPEFEKDREWKAKKLGEVVEFSKGKGISKNNIVSDGNLECIRYGELYTTYGEKIINVVSKTNLNKDDLVLSEINDVIIPSSGETQIDIATASCVLKSGVALGGDLNILKTKLDGVFLSYYLNSSKKYEIASMAQGVSIVHLYSSQLQNLKISFPTIKEQQKIASCLSSLDELIQAQTGRIEELKEHKKGLMQKLFPNPDSKN